MVIYAQDDLILDSEAHGDNWHDPNFNATNATIVDATPPKLWTGAVWSYINGAWAIVDSARYNELLNAETARQANSIRSLRAEKLVATDWTQCADISAAVKAQWVPYRKALRDVPQQAGFPFSVVWPT